MFRGHGGAGFSWNSMPMHWGNHMHEMWEEIEKKVKEETEKKKPVKKK